MNDKTPIFVCNCQEDKKFRLTFDGASTGLYQIEYCKACYDNDDRKFLIKEEMIK